MLLVLYTREGTCFKIHSPSGRLEPRAPDFQARALANRPLWSLAPLSFLMAPPCFGLSGMRQASYNQPQGIRVATGRSLTHQLSALSYHIYGAIYPSQSAGRGRSLPRSLQKGKVLDHISPYHWALMMMLRCCTFSEWFGSTTPDKHCKRKHSAGKRGRAEILCNGRETFSSRGRRSQERMTHLSETQ